MYIFVVSLILFSVLPSTLSDSRNTVTITKFECDMNDDIVKNVTCALNSEKAPPTFTVIAYTVRPVHQVIGNMQILRKSAGVYKPFILNTTEDMCAYLAGKNVNPYARIMMIWLKRFSNFNHPCPYEGEVYVKNVAPVPEELPIFIPTGDYRLDVFLYEGTPDKFLAKIVGWGTVGLKSGS